MSKKNTKNLEKVKEKIFAHGKKFCPVDTQ